MNCAMTRRTGEGLWDAPRGPRLLCKENCYCLFQHVLSVVPFAGTCKAVFILAIVYVQLLLTTVTYAQASVLE